MDDFVAEVRPIVYRPSPPFNPTPSSDDFVVEIRPLTPSEMRYRGSQCHEEDLSNQELLSILSGENFSRDGIARFLRGSMLDIVEKLLIGRPLAGVEGHLSVSFSNNELPISVVINKTYSSNNSPNDYDPNVEQTLKDSFNVRVKSGDSGMCPMSDETFGATSPLFEFDREQCNNVTETDDKSSLYSENHRDTESLACSPQHCLRWNSPTLSSPEDEQVTRLQAQVHGPGTQFENHRRHDSDDDDDDESGYTSNERGDSDSCYGQHAGCNRRPMKLYNSFNDYYCSGFDGDNTLYTPRDILTAVSNYKSDNKYYSGLSKKGTVEINDREEDFEFSHRLVIDESPREATRDRFVNDGRASERKLCQEFGQSMDVDGEDVLDVDEKSRQRQCFTDGAQICLNGFPKDGDFHDSSDITDTDVPVDVSGDSNITQDTVSVFPHIQSPVFRHPDGFRCKECSHILEDVAAVAFHVQTHHDLHFCTICCRTFTAKNNLKRHLRIHTGQRPYKCTLCPQSFARRDDLKDHTLRHEYNNPFRCSVCKRGYTDRASVKNHMSKEHGSRLMHVCPQCGESHDDEESFAAHKKTHPELQQFSCNKCSFIGTNHQMAQKHTLVHTYKLFSCKPCNAHFADPFDYTIHIRKHKKAASFSQYICCFCDLTLSTYDQFIRHEYSHAQAKTYGCKTCKKMFKTKSLLQDHAIIHQDLDFDKTEPLQRCVELSPAVESRQGCFTPSPEEESITGCIESSPEVQTIQRLFKSSPEVATHQRSVQLSPEVVTHQRSVQLSPEVATHQRSIQLSPEVATHQRSVQLSSELNEATSMLWQPSEVQDISFSPNTKPRSPLDSMPSPGTDSPTSKVEEHYVCQGELLDLSMKKHPSSTTRTDSPREDTSFSPYTGETRISETNFHRNAVVRSHSCFQSRGHEVNEQAFRECQRENTGDHQQGLLHVRAENSFDSSLNSEWDSSSSPQGPISPRTLRTPSRGSNNFPFSQPLINTQLKNNDLDGNVDDCSRDKPGRRPLGHRTSIDYVQKPSFRFSPYSRDKIADLAAKFVAARGTDIFHQRTFLKTDTPSWKNGHQATTLNAEYDRNEAPNLAQLKCNGVSTLKTLNGLTQSPVLVRTLPSTDKRSELFREVNSAHEISREGSNPETALSHAAFLVKTEPLLESVVLGKNVANGRLHHRDECGGVQRSTPSVCEDCKEVFGSFTELENHSVEVHKRFLCEHCKKSFTARPNRDRHVRYHTGERPYKCDLCDMAFFRGDDLKYHRTTRHPSAQPFTCSLCDASFAWRRDLDRHIRHSKCKS